MESKSHPVLAHAHFRPLLMRCFRSTGMNMTSTVSLYLSLHNSGLTLSLSLSLLSAGRHGRISNHIASLLTLLRSHLTHHRFTEATPIVETLAVATDRAPGVVWRVSQSRQTKLLTMRYICTCLLARLTERWLLDL